MNRLIDWCLEKAELKAWRWGVFAVGIAVIWGGLVWLLLSHLSGPRHFALENEVSMNHTPGTQAGTGTMYRDNMVSKDTGALKASVPVIRGKEIVVVPQIDLAASTINNLGAKHAEWEKQKAALMERMDRQLQLIDNLQRQVRVLNERIKDNGVQLEALQRASVVE